jgi:hypothetical protein
VCGGGAARGFLVKATMVTTSEAQLTAALDDAAWAT